VGRPPSRFSGQTRELGSAQRQTGQGLESSVTLRSRQHVRSASPERASMKYRIGCITEMRLPIGGFYGTAVRGGLSSDEAARRGKSHGMPLGFLGAGRVVQESAVVARCGGLSGA